MMMKVKITWVERGTNNAACLGLDETIEATTLDDAHTAAVDYAMGRGVDLERYDCVVDVVDPDEDDDEA